MISVFTLLIVLCLSILITRIATIALSHTGLSKESARFQARSAFTGVGFTTSESESVVNHPIRRRILLLLMLLGNAGIVTAVSALIVSFVDLDRSQTPVWRVAVLITGMLILWSLARSRWVDRQLSRIISRALHTYTDLSVKDYAELLRLTGDYQITELMVRKGDWLSGKSIAQARLKNEGILVLGVNRHNGIFIGAPDGDTAIEQKDVLILYGRDGVIQRLDQRRKGPAGDTAHQRESFEQATIKLREKQKDQTGEKDG